MTRWAAAVLVIFIAVDAKISPGIFYYPAPEAVGDEPKGISLKRTFFGNSSLEAYLECKDAARAQKSNYTISVWTFKTSCYKVYNDEIDHDMVKGYVTFLLSPNEDNKKDVESWTDNWRATWIRCYEIDVTCDTFSPVLSTTNSNTTRTCPGFKQLMDLEKEKQDALETKEEEEEETKEDGSRRKRRDTSALKKGIKELAAGSDPLKETFYPLITITKTGSFYIGWRVTGKQASPVNREYVELRIKARDRNLNSYLEAKDYPLLIFFGIMSGVYALLALIWFIVCAIHWRDILQIQIWIAAMLALNMVEMSVFCNKYQTVNNGEEVSDGLVIFAELLSTFKHGLSRVLVLIICMGYGIVKPRLGSTKHLVFALGLAYCLFVSIDSIYIKLMAPIKPLTQRQRLYAYIPRAVINAILIWWIVASLVATIRTLRMRRNVIKLTLYRHFSNALVFGIVACVAFEVWWIHLTKDGCIQNWKEYWLSDDIFWNLLFTMILIVIMFLWRPTINNSRYAFSPLLDADEDDEDEDNINEAFEGMKLRNIKKNGGTSSSKNLDDDLKWVEENIPSTLGDTVFEKLMDSDEEVEHRKYEMSKMQ